MSAFSSPSFSSALYALARPTYPPQILSAIASFHRPAPLNRALDLGCGTGQLARLLRADKVEGVPNPLRAPRVLAIDPSEGMVTKARRGLAESGVDGVECRTGNAEEVASLLQGEQVDLAVVGQAAHWFNHAKVWKELGKVVRSGGTVAYIGYGEVVLPSYPKTASTMAAFQRGDDWLGPWWEQPGRSIVVALLESVPFPPRDAGWGEGVRVKFDGQEGRELVMRKNATWAQFEEYWRTASAVHAYQEANPGDKERSDGDIVVRIIRLLREQVGKGVDQVEIAWPAVVLMVKRE